MFPVSPQRSHDMRRGAAHVSLRVSSRASPSPVVSRPRRLVAPLLAGVGVDDVEELRCHCAVRIIAARLQREVVLDGAREAPSLGRVLVPRDYAILLERCELPIVAVRIVPGRVAHRATRGDRVARGR